MRFHSGAPWTRRRSILAMMAAGLIVGCLAGCGAGPAGHANSGGVIRVPQDAPTISKAAAEATSGAMILVSPGTYRESVAIRAPHVTLRGLDRNTVIIDGSVDGIPTAANDVILLGAGDAVQNLTVRGAAQNGIIVTGETDSSGSGIGKQGDGYTVQDASKFPPVDGFVVDHVTSYNNGLYGIYAFDAEKGTIEDTYTSGHPDSGIYVGQCKPCDISVVGNVAEDNAVGYEGTNASGDEVVYGNRFVGNRVGATTDSDHQEALLPQDGAVMSGNVIADNQSVRTPEQADGGFGVGLGIAGGTDNVVSHNLITANSVVGLEITNTDDLPPKGNQIVDNTFSTNGVDVVYSASAAAGGSGNCLSGNGRISILPASLPTSCPATGATVTAAAAPATHAPVGIPFTQVAAPPATLPGISDPATAPAPVVPTAVTPTAAPDKTLLQEQSSIRW